jgi:hypothetical protein
MTAFAIADLGIAADNAKMQMIRLAVAVLLIHSLGSCGQQSVPRDTLPDGITPEMVERYKRIVGHRKPPANLIDAVEAQVARDPCVRNLDKWERLYSFGLDDRREVDESKVSFKYGRAGVYGIQAGKRVTAPEVWIMPDDRDYELVFGSYDRTSGKLSIEYCGPNFPEPTGEPDTFGRHTGIVRP